METANLIKLGFAQAANLKISNNIFLFDCILGIALILYATFMFGNSINSLKRVLFFLFMS